MEAAYAHAEEGVFPYLDSVDQLVFENSQFSIPSSCNTSIINSKRR